MARNTPRTDASTRILERAGIDLNVKDIGDWFRDDETQTIIPSLIIKLAAEAGHLEHFFRRLAADNADLVEIRSQAGAFWLATAIEHTKKRLKKPARPNQTMPRAIKVNQTDLETSRRACIAETTRLLGQGKRKGRQRALDRIEPFRFSDLPTRFSGGVDYFEQFSDAPSSGSSFRSLRTKSPEPNEPGQLLPLLRAVGGVSARKARSQSLR